MFRRTVDILLADPVLKTAIKTWNVWDGAISSKQLDLSSDFPKCTLLPKIGQQQWGSPDMIIGYLNVDITIQLKTRNVDDVMNLWEAFEDALYPYDDRLRQEQIQQSLRDLGSHTGQWQFAIPPSAPDPRFTEDDIFNCTGTMRLDVARPFNP